MDSRKLKATVGGLIACGIAIYAALHGRDRTGESAVQPPMTPVSARAGQADDRRRADFDFYLLAMSVHAAWCADGNIGKRECRAGIDHPLVIHGLWPERLEPRTYPRDCAGPRLDLEDATAAELRPFMPGMQSGLHDHEWREHGTCSGLGDDDYFRATLSFARDLDAALRAILTTKAGGEMEAPDLRAAADTMRAGFGRTITLHCRTLRDAPPGRRDRPYLVEVRQCVDDDGPRGGPGTPLDCATMKRRDQGCGGSFGIAR
jgi:ribonuclease I